jgi:hypothetical protein
MGENFKPQKYTLPMQYANVYRNGQADADNQFPDK